jgi:hypothetical protein
MLICSERKVLLANCWWLVADKPSEQGEYHWIHF